MGGTPARIWDQTGWSRISPDGKAVLIVAGDRKVRIIPAAGGPALRANLGLGKIRIFPKVQDAFATPGAHPVLTSSSPEAVALDVIGYDLAFPAVPEPTSIFLLGTLVALTGVVAGKRVKS